MMIRILNYYTHLHRNALIFIRPSILHRYKSPLISPFQSLTRSLALPKIPPSRALKHPTCSHQTERLLASICAIPASCVRHTTCSLLYYYYSSDPPFPHNEAVLVLYWQSNDNPHVVLKGQKYQELSKIIPVQCNMIHRSLSQHTVN